MKLYSKRSQIVLVMILSVLLLPGLIIPAISVIPPSNELTIISPVSSPPYNGPMEGYYPATFGFDDSAYTFEHWARYQGGGSAGIASMIDDSYTIHRGVLHLNDMSRFDHVSSYHVLQTPTKFGRIEFWLKVNKDLSDVSAKAFIKIYGGGDVQIEILLQNNWIYYKTPENEYDGLIPYTDGLWYHFQIWVGREVEKNKYGYILSANNQEITKRYINTLSKININEIKFHTGINELSDLYVDAVGFEWYEGYSNTDNRMEGLLIDFDPPAGIEFDETYYTLDGIEYDMSSRNTMVIPMIGGGIHSLQVCGIADSEEFLSDENFTFEIKEILPWGVDAINAECVWGGVEDARNVVSGNPAGQGVNVMVLDPTGFQYNHNDLNMCGGWDGGDDYIPEAHYSEAHGTHCAGIIASLDNDEGILGVAPQVNLFLSKEAIGHSVDWALDQHDTADNPYFETYGQIDIISFSASSSSGDVDDCQKAKDEGIIVVASSGNEGYPELVTPAAFTTTIGVGSVTYRYGQYVRSAFSNYGENLDLVAPGYQTFSTVLNNQYDHFDGTSQASPHVAGVCALLISRKPDLRGQFDLVKEALCRTATKVGGVSYNIQKEYGSWHPEYGYGMVNAKAAMDYQFDDPISYVEFISHTDGDILYRGSDVTFKVEEFEFDLVDKVEFRIAGGDFHEATQIPGTNEWKWTWTNTEDYDEGAYYISCRVTDEYGELIWDLIQINLENYKELAYQYTNILGTTISGNLQSTYYDDDNELTVRQQLISSGWFGYRFWKSEIEFRFEYDHRWLYEELKIQISKSGGITSMNVYYSTGGYSSYSISGTHTFTLDPYKPLNRIVIIHTYEALWFPPAQEIDIDYLWVTHIT